ncbi:NUDIX domain-containing protein [Alkalihalobacillus pseudalcaliphilus]|uniref:NUDIX domain-containing protein n=1 Tax=Alkalihalobacillus pseudalcaliphilus TaxID=79884 RepID=UPI00064DEA7C|nr:NUDIX domain-containing protein [Alkalihalobacillus pseudalcaliphilus]KMK75832.1 NUDIX hydrolase [Alkalihalobacillus pseudalcaliphilus]
MGYPIRVKAGALIIENKTVLLIEYFDENGLHYNLPGGGVEARESITEAVMREAKEEASIDVSVGPLAFVYDYTPSKNEQKYGPIPSLALYFACQRNQETTAKLPANPDKNQTAVRWIPLADLAQVTLFPQIQQHIIEYAQHNKKATFLEEHSL